MWIKWKILVHVYEDPNISFQRRLSVVIVWQEYSNCTRLVKYLALPVVVARYLLYHFYSIWKRSKLAVLYKTNKMPVSNYPDGKNSTNFDRPWN